LLTLKQVAELAGASRWTIWRWCAECGLRTVKIGGVTRIRERDWIAFLDRHAGAATEGGKE
jgi:excisionase family DNA binding protein